MKLYNHSQSKEKGIVVFVTGDEEDATLICQSLKPSEKGVIYAVEMDNEDYEEMAEEEEFGTLEGAIVQTSARSIEIIESAPEPPPIPKEQKRRDEKVSMIMTSRFWKHKWGHCCCVHHHGELVPVTSKRLADGEASWWASPLDPFQLDLVDSWDSGEGMHVLTDRICPRCNHPVWVVEPETMPKAMPEAMPKVSGIACDTRSPFELVSLDSIDNAWKVFTEDEHNAHVLKASGRCLTRLSKSKSSEGKAYKLFNDHVKKKTKCYTILAAFKAALGEGATTWAALDLDALKLIQGLNELKMPKSIAEMAGIGDCGDELDEQARTLESLIYMWDDDIDEELVDGEGDDRVRKPVRQEGKSEAKPRKSREVSGLLAASKALRQAIDEFILALESEQKKGRAL